MSRRRDARKNAYEKTQSTVWSAVFQQLHSNVPAGTYTVEIWHERLGTKTAQVTVPPSGSVELKSQLAAK